MVQEYLQFSIRNYLKLIKKLKNNKILQFFLNFEYKTNFFQFSNKFKFAYIITKEIPTSLLTHSTTSVPRLEFIVCFISYKKSLLLKMHSINFHILCLYIYVHIIIRALLFISNAIWSPPCPQCHYVNVNVHIARPPVGTREYLHKLI